MQLKEEKGGADAVPITAKRDALPLLLLALVTVFAFHDVVSHQFLPLWDDPLYVVRNPHIRGFSWNNVQGAFGNYFVGNYAPVQILSYMLDYTLWGLKPAGYFGANLCYHLLCGVLLYLLLCRCGTGRWGAMAGAAIFLVHPAQVENVAWVSQRKSLLALLFLLAAFHCYLNRGKPRGRWWYGLSLAAFTLSVLSKSVAVIFPLMLLYLDLLYPSRGNWWRRNLDKVPFLAIALVMGVIAILAQSPEHGGGRAGFEDASFLALPLTMLTVFVAYLRILFWPSPDRLSLIYLPPVHSSFDPQVVLAVVVASILVAGSVLMYRQKRPALFWYGLFFLGFLPVSQFVPLLTIMNDRYLNLPLVGFAGVAGHAVSWAMEKRPAAVRGVVAAGLVCVVTALAVVSHSRCRVWRDAVTLFSDTVPKVTSSRKPWLMLGTAYEAAGDADSAEICYQQSELPGSLSEADYMILGNILLARGEDDLAEAYLKWLERQKGHESTILFLKDRLPPGQK